MGFDTDKFQNAQFIPRTEDVRVDELKGFFDGEPIWKVRSLTGPELANVNEASRQNKALSELIDGFVGDDYAAKVKAIKESFGLTGEVPDEIVRGIAIMKAGSVDPECSQSLAVKIAESHPVPFYRIWRAIMGLSGLGATLGESSASTPIPESN